ncbi:hypothetical protein [Inhella crocodyli]|uniref:Uncharacterized protein n=1 Tax=Inhella crocodyli TaxID=2499851 RepID=A0A3S3T4D5_9BURK|nr:hypothetical protein [Inhella crocodyli]RVT83106.1 hypothetical protein EOD73_16250 [Inhella crocodyli]
MSKRNPWGPDTLPDVDLVSRVTPDGPPPDMPGAIVPDLGLGASARRFAYLGWAGAVMGAWVGLGGGLRDWDLWLIALLATWNWVYLVRRAARLPALSMVNHETVTQATPFLARLAGDASAYIVLCFVLVWTVREASGS